MCNLKGKTKNRWTCFLGCHQDSSSPKHNPAKKYSGEILPEQHFSSSCLHTCAICALHTNQLLLFSARQKPKSNESDTKGFPPAPGEGQLEEPVLWGWSHLWEGNEDRPVEWEAATWIGRNWKRLQVAGKHRTGHPRPSCEPLCWRHVCLSQPSASSWQTWERHRAERMSF